MRYNALAAALATALMVPGVSFAAVLINEVSYDDSGTDDREFVEIYNSGVAPVDISGWELRASDTVAPPGDNNADYTVPANTMLAAGGYYVFGAGTVANVNQDVGATNLWENDNEGLELLDAAGAVQDTAIYELNKGPIGISPGEGGIWGNFTSIDGLETSWGRYVDGADTNVNGRDFGMLPSTPGASNTLPSNANYQIPDVDGLGVAVGADVPGLHGSFVHPRAIDPTVADGNNPNAIPPSPGGGNAIVAWDPSGGGNMGFSTELVTKFDFFAYLDTSFFGTPGTTDVPGAESTTYGIGTTGTFYNFPDPTGDLFGDTSTANGNTGIGWIYEKEDSASLNRLLLVDSNDGGPSNPSSADWTVLESIDMSNVPSGWYRLAIDYDPTTGDFTAVFDDQTFNHSTISDLVGTFYIGYRESLEGTPTFLRPPTLDVVPEPASWMLLVMTGVGMALARRR